MSISGPSCLTDVQAELLQVFAKSGKGFDQTGLYYDCISSILKTVYYFILFENAGQKESNRVFMGVCVPPTCSAKDIHDQVDGLMIMNKFPLRVNSVVEPAAYEYEKGGLFWFTVIWLGLLTLSVLLATLFKIFRRGVQNKLVNCFALQENLKIFTMRESSLTFFNGIRCICLFWIVLGHSVTIRVIDTQNWITLKNQFNQVFALVPLGAFFAVDIFFYLGGFLLGYVFFSQLKKNNVGLYFMAMIHRLLRFYPSYITAILIWYQIFPHLGSGPFWPQVDRFVEPCNFMWRNILFIDNMWDKFSCLPWAWYLSNDIQLFAMCLILIALYTKFPKASVILMIGMMIGSVVFNYIVSYQKGYITVSHIEDIFFHFNPYFFNLYIKPWSRCPPYLLGLIMGIEYFKFFKFSNQLKKHDALEDEKEDFLANNPHPLFYKLKVKLQKFGIIRYSLYLIGLFLIFFFVFIPRYPQIHGLTSWSQTTHSLYLSCSKILFTIGVGMLLFPATLGISDFVMNIFDNKFFSIIAKISFWTYLIHYIVIMRNSYSLKQADYFTFFEIFMHFLTDLSISLFLGFAMTMIVEAPFVKLEKLVFKRDSKSKEKPVDSTSIITQSIISDSSANSASQPLMNKESIGSIRSVGKMG